MSFFDDLKKHHQRFAADRGVSPDDVLVHVTVADGSTFTAKGLDVQQEPDGSYMVRGSSLANTDALIVREPHALKVIMDLRPNDPSPIGFHAETSK